VEVHEDGNQEERRRRRGGGGGAWKRVFVYMNFYAEGVNTVCAEAEDEEVRGRGG
jgi:hypothetical protein